MNLKRHLFPLALIILAGLLSGFAARRMSSGSPGHAISTATAPPVATQREKSTPEPAKSALPEIPVSRSGESLESILAAGPGGEYARIALWMTTASEEDLAAYWKAYKGGKRAVAVTDLVFLNWTRRNPQAATAAVAGTKDERYAWWAWAANDPAAALAAARGGDPKRMSQVASGIGDFNPEWLRTHLDQIPEEFRGDAFDRMRDHPAGQDPLVSMKLMKENGVDFDGLLLQSLARKDPWAALEWLKENPEGNDPFAADVRWKILANTMARENPEALERLVDGMPEGEKRRDLEQALFDQLAETDPAAALEKARSAKSPLIAAQRLGQIALGIVSTDPDQAFAIAGEILAANQGRLDIRNRVEYENSFTWSMTKGKATELMDALFAKDRERTLAEMGGQTAGESGMNPAFSKYAGEWAEDDLESFMGWAGRQSRAIQQASSEQIGLKLASRGDYSQAVEWVESASLASDGSLANVLYQWDGSDPAAAAAWLESSGLTNEQKSKFRDMLKKRNTR